MELRFKETKIKISFFFALSICVISIFDRSNVVLQNLLAAALHEAGHITVMMVFGEKPREIRFTPFGMRIERKEMNNMNFKKEALIAAAGPITNFLSAAICIILNRYFSLNLTVFTAVNIALGVLNLTPCEPLDGYRVTRYILMQKTSEEKTEKILKISSLVFLFPIASAGFYVLLKSGFNFSLLLVAVYLCAFLFVGNKSI